MCACMTLNSHHDWPQSDSASLIHDPIEVASKSITVKFWLGSVLKIVDVLANHLAVYDEVAHLVNHVGYHENLHPPNQSFNRRSMDAVHSLPSASTELQG